MITYRTNYFRGTGLLIACLLGLWFWIIVAALVWWIT